MTITKNIPGMGSFSALIVEWPTLAMRRPSLADSEAPVEPKQGNIKRNQLIEESFHFQQNEAGRFWPKRSSRGSDVSPAAGEVSSWGTKPPPARKTPLTKERDRRELISKHQTTTA